MSSLSVYLVKSLVDNDKVSSRVDKSAIQMLPEFDKEVFDLGLKGSEHWQMEVSVRDTTYMMVGMIHLDSSSPEIVGRIRNWPTR